MENRASPLLRSSLRSVITPSAAFPKTVSVFTVTADSPDMGMLDASAVEEIPKEKASTSKIDSILVNRFTIIPLV